MIKKFNCPLAYTGDIFDKWRVEPELINFALHHLPVGYSVAGNHDTPNHQMSQIHRSAYYTLVASEKLIHLHHGHPMSPAHYPRLKLWGYSYGENLTVPNIALSEMVNHVAVVHRYVWQEGHTFPGVPKEAHVSEFKARLFPAFDAAVFGDNHKGFLSDRLLNGGGFMRRRSDEVSYTPYVGLLTESCEWRRWHLDVSNDKTCKPDKRTTESLAYNFVSFLNELDQLGDSSLDFEQFVKEYVEKKNVSKEVRQIISRCMGQ